jgi:hypothetical protein
MEVSATQPAGAGGETLEIAMSPAVAASEIVVLSLLALSVTVAVGLAKATVTDACADAAGMRAATTTTVARTTLRMYRA